MRNIATNSKRVISLLSEYQDFVVFDTETNGLRDDAKIIQFSAIHFSVDDLLNFKEIERLDVYINPEEPLPEKIIELTGITDELLSDKPKECEIGHQILNWMSNIPVWVAYNSDFDVKKLIGMAKRLQYPFFAQETIDLLVIARDCISKNELASHKLANVYNYLFSDSNDLQFHSAIDDVIASSRIFANLINVYLLKAMEPKEEKKQIHLEWACFAINPRKQSEQRIKLNVDKDKLHYGDIFWDVLAKCWDCKKTPQAKKLFEEIDMENLEQQVLEMYGNAYDASDMDTLARNWSKHKRAKK